MNNFDFIAPFYDQLAGMVFGKAIKNSQLKFISLIPPNAHVLIVGGGTGWIADCILTQSKNVSITYVEKSQKMIEIAKSRIPEKHLIQVNFINASFETFTSKSLFDVVICNFFLDLFPLVKLKDILSKIKQLIKENGLLFVTDFQLKNSILILWQKPLLIVMHWFFRMTTSLESKNLKPIHNEIRNSGFHSQETSYFFYKLIRSSVYITFESASFQR